MTQSRVLSSATNESAKRPHYCFYDCKTNNLQVFFFSSIDASNKTQNVFSKSTLSHVLGVSLWYNMCVCLMQFNVKMYIFFLFLFLFGSVMSGLHGNELLANSGVTFILFPQHYVLMAIAMEALPNILK